MLTLEIPIEVLTFGGAMLVLVMLVHGAGLDRIVAYYNNRSQMLRERAWHPHAATYIFAVTILFVLILHVLEICIWGFAVDWMGLIPNLRNSMYFCANTYVTIGYGQMLLPSSWRELGPLMAISGLFSFAWTTGQLFAIVGYHHDLSVELARLRKTRKESQHGERAGTAREKPQHTDAVAKESNTGAMLSAEERRALRDEIEQKLRQLHDAERAVVEGLRREEVVEGPAQDATAQDFDK